MLFCFHVTIAQKLENNFALDGKSSIVIENQTTSRVKISIENSYLLPSTRIKTDTLLEAGESVVFQLVTQGKSYFKLSIDKHDYQLFHQPESENVVTISNNENTVDFSGSLKRINRYLAQRANDFNSIHSDWRPRVNFTHKEENFVNLIEANDSITSQHLSHLLDHQDQLPDWFVTFETKRLLYLNAGFKINSLMYRKRMMDKVDILPEDFLENTIDTLAINDEAMLGNMRYMMFLGDYVAYKCDPNFDKPMPESKEQWERFYQDFIEKINDNLTGEVQDTYLAMRLANILKRRGYVYKDEWLDRIENEELISYVNFIKNANPILPEGADTPYFYLTDSAGNTHESEDFRGKVVLINFWATWCKPCIKEFPFDNQLVEKFKDKDVEIVNICIDSNESTWKKLIEKHDLITTNLLAKNNWNDNLKMKFGIQALPHSVLIDQQGKVVLNKCPRASEGIADMISDLLE